MTSKSTNGMVYLTTDCGVSTITLDSPHNRNALSGQLRSELLTLLTEALADETTRVIVLTHTGSVFCAGADLREARSGDTTRSGDELVTLLKQVMTSSKPVVARLAGPARAGGTGLVAACDFAIAADTVTFGFSEVRIGVIPSIISVPLRIRVAPQALHRLFLSGETFDARHAASIGLISDVTSEADLDSAVSRLTDTLKLGSPTALAGVKELLHPSEAALSERFAQMQTLTSRYFLSPDAQEGIRAFAEKRSPAWASDTAKSSS